MQEDYSQRLSAAFEQAFRQLGLEVDEATCRSLAATIQDAMGSEGRYYHTPQHALAMVDEGNPIQTLAALFHDVVYIQVDQGFSPEIAGILQAYLQTNANEKNGYRLVDEVRLADASFHLVKDIFGLALGSQLPEPYGTNEFLSSLVMAKKLESIVPTQVLAQVSVLIEATIPFRTADTQGADPFETLFERLRRAVHAHRLSLSQEGTAHTLHEAVVFANKDVENFHHPDPAHFLDGTWNLLPEFHPALRRGRVYTLVNYRQALQAMKNFLCRIQAENVLHAFRGYPPEAELRQKQSLIERNLSIGCRYLEIKLLTVAILEGLADISGGDLPIEQLIGGVGKNGKEADQLGNFLPQVRQPANTVEAKDVLDQLLQTGRRGPVDDADVKTAPLAAFLYRTSEANKIRAYLEAAEAMFAGRINAEKFLKAMDPSMLVVILEAVSRVAPSREASLRRFSTEMVK